MKTTTRLTGLRTCLSFIVFALLFSCAKDNPGEATDYSQSSHWLSLPATVFKADVFYLYPTTTWTTDNANSLICAIDDSLMMLGAASAFARQATAFETSANVYAPFYRQDNLSPDNRLNAIAGIPTTDVTAAFDYYIRHFNSGRPFILAGHSQGANIINNLLAGYLKDNPQVYARMIAAYVIGGPVTKEFLAANPHLKFATGPDDTGVIISYNTEAPGVTGENPVLYGMVSLVINPITWTREETLATKDENLGSFMPDLKTLLFMKVSHCADARVDTTKGVLICNTLYKDFITMIDAAQGFPTGVYHSFDFPLYYYNIRENATNRINKFLTK